MLVIHALVWLKRKWGPSELWFWTWGILWGLTSELHIAVLISLCVYILGWHHYIFHFGQRNLPLWQSPLCPPGASPPSGKIDVIGGEAGAISRYVNPTLPPTDKQTVAKRWTMYVFGFYKWLLFVNALNETCFKGGGKGPQDFSPAFGCCLETRGVSYRLFVGGHRIGYSQRVACTNEM